MTYSCPFCSYLNPLLHGNGLTFAITCSTSDYQLSSICAGVSLLHVQFYLRFLYTRFPHLRCLHADSITCPIHMMYFTRYFHYLRNPYTQNDHYPQFHYTRIKSPPKNFIFRLIFKLTPALTFRCATLLVINLLWCIFIHFFAFVFFGFSETGGTS